MSPEHRIALAVPALPEYLRVVRVTASGLASRLGFGIDDVDDLRLALDELCFAVIGSDGDEQELRLQYVLGTDELSITGHVINGSAIAVNEFSRQILTALVDDHRLWNDGDRACFELKKRKANA